MDNSRIFVTGANGQLGTALRALLPEAYFTSHEQFDITDASAYEKVNWQDYDIIINAAAMTNVDGAETTEGRQLAWKLNANAVGLLSDTASKHHLTLVHVSSDYVFDGTKAPHEETENFSPISSYGASKAAGDIVASLAPQHYIVRTTWVIGHGKNFVRTMWDLAQRGIKPSVVDDQLGRLTFADDLAGGIAHLLSTKAPFGTYHLTNDGKVASWAEFAKLTFTAAGKPADDVTGVTTEQYFAGKENIAPRPLQSELRLTKIKEAGFSPRDWQPTLDKYLKQLQEETI